MKQRVRVSVREKSRDRVLPVPNFVLWDEGGIQGLWVG